MKKIEVINKLFEEKGQEIIKKLDNSIDENNIGESCVNDCEFYGWDDFELSTHCGSVSGTNERIIRCYCTIKEIREVLGTYKDEYGIIYLKDFPLKNKCPFYRKGEPMLQRLRRSWRAKRKMQIMYEIFKLQKPVAYGNNEILIYNEDKSYMSQNQLSDEVNKLFEKSLKIYVIGHVDNNGTLHILRKTTKQDW